MPDLEQKLNNRTAVIGIVGLGYVGLPLAVVFSEAGFKVLGFDMQKKRVDSVNKRQSYVATIGANATIVCGNTVGEYALIGAGSVVTKDVPDYALVYGNPGRIQGWVCQCGVKLQGEGSKAQCPE